MNQRNPGRRAMRIAWAVLLVVFAAYVAVALGVGGSGVLDFFSSWVCIGLVLGAAALLALRGFASDDRRAPWLVALARRGDVGGRGAHLRARLLRRARARALPVDRRRVLARLVLRGRHRHRARAALAAAARVPRHDVARRRHRRRHGLRAGGDHRLRPRAHRHRGLRLGDRDRPRLSAARPRPALARRHAARADRLAARARLGAVRGRALDAGDLRRPVRARDRARHRLGRHAARAAVAGGDAAARLRRLAAARARAAPRRAARARVHLPGRVHADRARDPRLRPDPLGQHARRRARRDRDRARRRRGWRCRSSTTCGCCGAPARTR